MFTHFESRKKLRQNPEMVGVCVFFSFLLNMGDCYMGLSVHFMKSCQFQIFVVLYMYVTF